MRRYRSHSDSYVHNVRETDKWRREKTTTQLTSYHTQTKPLVSTKDSFISTRRSPSDVRVIDLTGSDFPPEVEINDRTYYTSSIDEGFASIEVVADSNNKIDEPQKIEETEIFTATPFVEFDIFPEGLDEELDNNDSVLNFSSFSSQHRNQPESNIVYKPFKFKTTSQVDSDSDSDEFFNFFPDNSSSDEEYPSSPSSITLKPASPVLGNLPFLHKLDAVEKTEPVFKIPFNPLISKRMPTATTTYLSGQSLVGASLDFNNKPPANADDAINKDKKQQETSMAVDEEIEGKFCTTNVQSALLNKITANDEALDLSVPPSRDLDLPNLPRRASRKGSKFPLKVKPSKQKEDMGDPTESFRNNYTKHITTDLQNFESEVGKAFEESVSEGSVMPLLKQELHCKIQVRRLSMGKPELILEPEEPKKYELTPEELEKKIARLEQNRRSARNSRRKARSYEKQLQKIIKNEMKENARLTKELVFLQNEKKKYEKMYDDHTKICVTHATD